MPVSHHTSLRPGVAAAPRKAIRDFSRTRPTPQRGRIYRAETGGGAAIETNCVHHRRNDLAKQIIPAGEVVTMVRSLLVYGAYGDLLCRAGWRASDAAERTG